MASITSLIAQARRPGDGEQLVAGGEGVGQRASSSADQRPVADLVLVDARSRRRPSSTRAAAARRRPASKAWKTMPLTWSGSRLRRCITTSSTENGTGCSPASTIAARATAPPATIGSAATGSTRCGCSPSRPRTTALTLPWPWPVAPASRTARRGRGRRRGSRSSARSPSANRWAAFIGPTVCELEGPMPDLEQVEHADGHGVPSAAGAHVGSTPDHGALPSGWQGFGCAIRTALLRAQPVTAAPRAARSGERA